MAWGMFCRIPCPYKEWREEDRKAQLCMFPLVGTFIAVILCLIWKLLSVIGAGNFIGGAILTGAYFLMTGFIHIDGFMDCCDAIMPQHPDIEKRVKILKDPHSGSFAIISTGLMLVIFAGAMMQIAESFSPRGCCMLAVIFTTSRFMSAHAVLTCTPMKTSQYAGRTGSMKDTIPAIIVFLAVLTAAELISANGSWTAIIGELYSDVVAVVVIIAAAAVGAADRKALGGMNGDISGHMITVSEMLAVLAMALLYGR